jgi:uroporphyrinogen decarboxylase
VKPWVETDADMDRLECVYLPPERTDAQLEAEFGEVKDRAERWQVPMYMLVGSGLYAAYSIFGAEQAVWLSMDKPELVERLADLEHEVTLARIEIASRIGVHMVRRSSHYETTDFCNPEQVRRYMVPRFRREIELAHQHGMAMVSAACTGVMPILDVLEDLDFDCLFDFDPTLGGQDLAMAWEALGRKKSFWGGISEATHVHMGSEATVREAVRDFYETCGPRGTILAAVSTFQPEDPIENIRAMIGEWKKVREGWAN